MDDIFDAGAVEGVIAAALDWVRAEAFVWGTVFQVSAVVVAMVLAYLAAPFLRSGAARLRQRFGLEGWAARGVGEIEAHAFPFVWLAIQWLFMVLVSGTRWGGQILEITVSLVAAWVAIQFASIFIRNRAAARMVAIFVWTVAALDILDLLNPTVRLLDAAAVELGGFRLSVIVVIKGLILFAILLWVALLLAQTIERRVATSEVLSPSIRVLANQLTKIVLVTIAVVVALASVGVDLTAFAVFTGALGVGVGFGLQKVVANLVSGVMMLLDRSIKPGDVIAVEGTYGWVNFMGARYVSLVTRDGTEHLIPNETLITSSVENWSYSHELLRLKVPIGISYKSDPHRAIELIKEAAAEVERVLADPSPVCLMTGFGDSSVDLEARIWINDPRNGVSNVKSEVLLRVWDKFHQEGIEIPFPQRDLHLKSATELPVAVQGQ